MEKKFRQPIVKNGVTYLPYDRRPEKCPLCGKLIGRLAFYDKMLAVNIYPFKDGWRYAQKGLKTQYHRHFRWE
jgi:hypothetical protein